jgi:hypothetical protein
MYASQVLFEFDTVPFTYHFLICVLRNVAFKANFSQKLLMFNCKKLIFG